MYPTSSLRNRPVDQYEAASRPAASSAEHWQTTPRQMLPGTADHFSLQSNSTRTGQAELSSDSRRAELPSQIPLVNGQPQLAWIDETRSREQRGVMYQDAKSICLVDATLRHRVFHGRATSSQYKALKKWMLKQKRYMRGDTLKPMEEDQEYWLKDHRYSLRYPAYMTLKERRENNLRQMKEKLNFWMTIQMVRLRNDQLPARGYEPGRHEVLHSLQDSQQTAFASFMRLLRAPELSEDFKATLRERLEYHATGDKTLFEDDGFLLEQVGLNDLLKSGYADESPMAYLHQMGRPSSWSAIQMPGDDVPQFLIHATKRRIEPSVQILRLAPQAWREMSKETKLQAVQERLATLRAASATLAKHPAFSSIGSTSAS